jgi:hypothetical protein
MLKVKKDWNYRPTRRPWLIVDWMITRIFRVPKVKTLNKRETENKIKICSEVRTTQDGKVRADTDAREMIMEGCR